jgi:hypothetical protein
MVQIEEVLKALQKPVVDYLDEKLKKILPTHVRSYLVAMDMWNDIEKIVRQVLRDKGL